MKVASLCTIPVRHESFHQVLHSILNEQTQTIDTLHIWLNGFSEIPPDLPRDARLQVHLEPSNPGPWIRYRPAKDLQEDDIFITLDDDLIYPSDYVKRGVMALNQQAANTSICFGGVIWDWVVPSTELDYHPHKRLIPYPGLLDRDQPVPVLMGGAGFHYSKNVQNVIGMVLPGFATNDDLMVSYHLQQQDVKIVSAAKPQDWIGEHPSQSAPHALNRRDIPTRVATFRQLVQRFGFIPWTMDVEAERTRPVCLVICIGPILSTEVAHLQTFCAPDERLHTLEILIKDFGQMISRPLRAYPEHFVTIPEASGRFENIPGVRQWRQRRVASQGWQQVQQYLSWLKAALKIKKVILLPSEEGPVWLVENLRAWKDEFLNKPPSEGLEN